MSKSCSGAPQAPEACFALLKVFPPTAKSYTTPELLDNFRARVHCKLNTYEIMSAQNLQLFNPFAVMITSDI